MSGGFVLGAPGVPTYLYGNGSPALFYGPSGLFGLSSVTGFVGVSASVIGGTVVGVAHWVGKKASTVESLYLQHHDHLTGREVGEWIGRQVGTATS